MPRYEVYIPPAVLKDIEQLPGNIRSRIRRVILSLRDEPVVPQSRPLNMDLPSTQELRRVRLDDWRLIYLVDNDEHRVYVLAVRHRPPYSYDDLAFLVEGI